MRESATVAGIALLAVLHGCETPPASIPGPPTWSTIYEDYFAPSTVGGCGGTTRGCHSSPSDPGAATSKLVCADMRGCYESLTQTSALIVPADRVRPTASGLVRALRHARGEGEMPKDSSFVFERGDIERISNWIARGAPED